MSKNNNPATAPVLVFEPEKDYLLSGGESFARIFIRLPAAQIQKNIARKGLACSFTLDCSGSMAEPAGPADKGIALAGISFGRHAGPTKIEQCKKAILEAIELLDEKDMASLTAFSSSASTLFPMSFMTKENKEKLIKAVEKCSPDGGTNLHDGWALAGKEAAKGLDHKLLSRVILFTDGEATNGERSPEELARRSAKLNDLGVSTSCFGVGERFNEDLLCSMADSGAGNFRYIPDALQAASAAVDEVNGLGASVGRKARIEFSAIDGIEEAGVIVLNDFLREDSAFVLPSLVAGRDIEMVIGFTSKKSAKAARFAAKLSWQNRDGIRQSEEKEFEVELVPQTEFEALKGNEEVQGAKASLLAAKEKSNMAMHLSTGNFAGATASLSAASAYLCSAGGSYSGLDAEMADLRSLSDTMAKGDMNVLRKQAFSQSYARSRNQTTAPKDKTSKS